MEAMAGLVRAGQALLDALAPQECGGCHAPGLSWCPRCEQASSPRARRLRPQFDPGVPVYACGRYSGPLRNAILAAKAHGRRDMAAPLGERLAAVLAELRGDALLHAGRGLRLVPAPSRPRVSRLRGGDPVLRMAEAASAALANIEAEDLLRYRRGVRDSVGLSAAGRLANVWGAARVQAVPSLEACRSAVLVDDVLTSGATACESVRALSLAGVRVACVVVLAG